METFLNKLFPFLFLILANLPGLATPVISNFRTNADTVPVYEKFEIRMDIEADFVNPFDPDEIDITVIFTAPSGKEWKIFGFYNYSDWRSLWMVRFSPDESGNWSYIITIRDRTGILTDKEKNFTAVRSALHGPVRVAENQRYLEYDDGTPYYGVGLWYNDGYSAFNQGRILPGELDGLKDLGVNFISTYITPLETYGTGLGRYDQNLCGRLDEVLQMCEERDIQLSLNIWFHSYLSKTVWGGGNIRWNTNPYQTICRVEDFFRSKLAWYYQEKLYRYFIARWGYSRSLGIWFIVDEVNGTDGWISGDSIMAADWGRRVHDYFKANDPWQHLTTGTRSGGITQFWHRGYQIFDLAAREIYEAQGFPITDDGKFEEGDTHPLEHSYKNYAGEIRTLWDRYGRPAIIGETGWDHSFYEPGMPGYYAQYHNALWACLGSGAAMTPFWWAFSGRVNDNVVTNQIRNLRRFVDEIPFSALTGLQPLDSVTFKGDAFVMQSDQMIYGWAVNPYTDVVGDTITLHGLENGQYTLRMFHTWRGSFLEKEKLTVLLGSCSFAAPVLHITGTHANYVGQDIAFILEKITNE